MKYKRESEMESPVKKWLEELGYIVHRQSPMPGGGVPDLLGYSMDFENFIVIELKLNKFLQALSQAEGYRPYCHFSYIAFPVDMAKRIMGKHRNELVKAGIGLLAVTPEGVEVFVPAAINLKADWKDLYCRFTWDIKKELIKRAEKL